MKDQTQRYTRDKPLSYNDEQKDMIVEAVEQNPELSLRIIAQDNTISNLLHNEGFTKQHKKITFAMNDNHIKGHSQYAIKRVHRTQWMSLWFSDESKLCLKRRSKDNAWIRKEENKNQIKFLKEEDRWNQGLEILVFGAISINGAEYLEWYDSSLNGVAYQQILKNALVDYDNFHVEDHYFMQDNASIHTCKSTINFLEDNHINLIDWSTKWTDINPIDQFGHSQIFEKVSGEEIM